MVSYGSILESSLKIGVTLALINEIDSLRRQNSKWFDLTET